MSSWERLAAFEGGTISGLATARASDGTVRVFAATPVGVFQSDDGGRRWKPLGADSAVAGVEVVAPSPRYAEDGTLFAGARDGLLRWQDNGGGWTHLLAGSRVLSLAVLPGDASRLTLLAGTEDDGILVSRDDGQAWSGANPGLFDLTILALAVSPSFARDGLAFAATTSGLYRTRNGAESWRQIELDWEDAAIQCLALSPGFAEDRLILAGTEEYGLLRSDDAGRTWEQARELEGRSVNGIAFITAERVVAATDADLALSEDAGASWRMVGAELGPVLSVAGMPSTPAGTPVLLAGHLDAGVARSEDGGQAWTETNDGLAARLVVGLTLSPTFEQDQTIYVASLDAGTQVSDDGGVSWAEGDAGQAADDFPDLASAPFARAEIVALGFSPAYEHDGTLYAATAGSPSPGPAGGLTLWRSTDWGQRWTRWLNLPGPAGGSAVRLAVLPENRWGDTVVLGIGGLVYRPRQRSWQVVGGARRPVWDTVEIAGPGVPGRPSVITALAASPAYATDRTLFAATSTGVIVSRDGGGGFPAWSEGLEPASTVAVAPSPAYARDRLVYALGLGGTVWRRRDDERPG